VIPSSDQSTAAPPCAIAAAPSYAAPAVMFNGAIGTSALSAAFELGLLDRLDAHGTLPIASFCADHGLHRGAVSALLRALACFGVISVATDGDTVARGPCFEEACRERGYFLWLVKGYGHLWRNLAACCRIENRPADADDREFVGRDGASIAIAGRDYGGRFVDRAFERLLDQQSWTVAGDLGCGSASRLIELARSRPNVRGVGVEVDAAAVSLARRLVDDADLSGRVDIVHADIRSLAPRGEFANVDVLFCFFMGHDLWPGSRCQAVLGNLRRVFPKTQRFLLCDTFRGTAAPSPFLPTFQLGFEWTHAVMGQDVPSEADWLDLLAEGEWRCVRRVPIEIPSSAIFDLRPRRAEPLT
jgi:SAM-dependent methyltransferase